MKDKIRQIIESEYRAKKIISEAEEERKLAEAEIEKEIQKLRDEIFNAAREKIEKARAENTRYALSHAERIMSEAKEKASLMKSKFEANRAAWAQSLLGKILGR